MAQRFAREARRDQLLLNQPGAGGAGAAMPDGRVPASGGWNQIQIEVEDISLTVEKLRHAGCRFRNDSQITPAIGHAPI
jgi:hypothetical protein